MRQLLGPVGEPDDEASPGDDAGRTRASMEDPTQERAQGATPVNSTQRRDARLLGAPARVTGSPTGEPAPARAARGSLQESVASSVGSIAAARGNGNSALTRAAPVSRREQVSLGRASSQISAVSSSISGGASGQAPRHEGRLIGGSTSTLDEQQVADLHRALELLRQAACCDGTIPLLFLVDPVRALSEAGVTAPPAVASYLARTGLQHKRASALYQRIRAGEAHPPLVTRIEIGRPKYPQPDDGEV